jgi:dihydroorotate dehydrogenase
VQGAVPREPPWPPGDIPRRKAAPSAESRVCVVICLCYTVAAHKTMGNQRRPPAMTAYRTLLRPLLFRLDAERVHDRTIRWCELLGGFGLVRGALSRLYGFRDPRLEREVCGVRFPNPVGLAAGFDKSGRATQLLAAMGFGHVEIGSVSADPSEGNPRPRLWRLPQDKAIIVNYGLPNDGAQAVADRLADVRLPVPLGINIVKTNRGVDAPQESGDEIIDDYVRSVRLLMRRADYVNLNLSCPNTETGRDFFADPGKTRLLMDALRGLDIACPVFLKVSPLGGVRAIEELLAAVEGAEFVSGFVFNLPPGKPDTLVSPPDAFEGKPGAVSGKPVEDLINVGIKELYSRMDRSRYHIIGVGGVFSAEDAYRRIQLGACLVQLMTSLVYEGPGVVKAINRGLVGLLERDGFARIAEAVGTGHT